MSEVLSTFSLPLGAAAPDFTLPDASGKPHALADVRGPKGLIVAFLCNHCPFVIHLAPSLGKQAAEWARQGVGFVGINANDVERYPADSPELMATTAQEYGWSFPYLYDATQEVARAYAAACTPDFYLFDGELRLMYCGQYDASRPRNGKPVTGSDVQAAMLSMLAGTGPVQNQRPSSGCNIKWKPGNEPRYFLKK